MLEAIKELLSNQYEAAFCTLGACVEQCPDEGWNAPVANLAFCQVAFHTLFFADFYLGQNEESFRQQTFHRQNETSFRDYEELQDRPQQLHYDRSFVKAYLSHCRNKASEAVRAQTAESLCAPCGFERREFSRAELHVYNIRHVQHHAAQLSLRMRLDFKKNIPWFGTGWSEA